MQHKESNFKCHDLFFKSLLSQKTKHFSTPFSLFLPLPNSPISPNSHLPISLSLVFLWVRGCHQGDGLSLSPWGWAPQSISITEWDN